MIADVTMPHDSSQKSQARKHWPLSPNRHVAQVWSRLQIMARVCPARISDDESMKDPLRLSQVSVTIGTYVNA